MKLIMNNYKFLFVFFIFLLFFSIVKSKDLENNKYFLIYFNNSYNGEAFVFEENTVNWILLGKTTIYDKRVHDGILSNQQILTMFNLDKFDKISVSSKFLKKCNFDFNKYVKFINFVCLTEEFDYDFNFYIKTQINIYNDNHKTKMINQNDLKISYYDELISYFYKSFRNLLEVKLNSIYTNSTSNSYFEKTYGKCYYYAKSNSYDKVWLWFFTSFHDESYIKGDLGYIQLYTTKKEIFNYYLYKCFNESWDKNYHVPLEQINGGNNYWEKPNIGIFITLFFENVFLFPLSLILLPFTIMTIFIEFTPYYISSIFVSFTIIITYIIVYLFSKNLDNNKAKLARAKSKSISRSLLN
jgi:hypothetical protein